MVNPTPDSAPDAARLLRAARELPHQRVAAIELDGRRYWIKRPEAAPLRLRLQKGNGAAAFQREMARLTAFAERGAPVPAIMAQSPDMVILADAGLPLSHLAQHGPAEDMVFLLAQAARALAGLHAAGLAHGRPRLRDICWDGADIRFLDLEAGARLDAPRWRRARDLLIFLHSIFQHDTDMSALAGGALAAYGDADHAQVAPLARKMARGLAVVAFLVAPLIRRDRKRGKKNSEFVALADLLNFLS
ncbi:hypothetical protein [Roseinatronobacter alkalisoli]|uniref:Serine/threonine protein phosphatase n=1 Tax=Roseinatronobacter alkalisoli TaxID=3028235 RepID=A0ABT5TDY1_9RHOB|nr:hypothetical protein [Roseinatronobacter sp. HJB301]MDD7972377.1 hypothetical protein [Roseinatronobacter sp. HJB301]